MMYTCAQCAIHACSQEAPATTVIAKDRVLAHDPAGALYCAEGNFKNKL